MRVLDAFAEPVRTVAVSPDGRFLAAATVRELGVWDWVTAEPQHRRVSSGTGRVTQFAWGPNASWLACAYQRGLFELLNPIGGARLHLFPGTFAGGVAVSPNGREIVATHTGRQGQVKVDQWELPSLKPKTGFPDWSAFTRLAFSRNGEFIAGVGPNRFELRIAGTGGWQGRYDISYVGDGFFSFSRDSQTVVFGWETDLRIMETRNGNVRAKPVTQPEARAFLDVAFLGSGHLATVDGTSVMRLWSPDSWEITRGYNWDSGGLTCVVSSADGLSGVCGTSTGKLVVFDVDE